MEQSLNRQVTFHLLSLYEGFDAEWNYSTPRTGASRITVTMSADEVIWDGAVRALQSDPKPRNEWLLDQVLKDSAHLKGLKSDASETHWTNGVDEEYLIYSIDHDGSLRIHMWRDHRTMTVADVESVVEAGYVHAKSGHFVIHGPEGKGGDFGTWDMAAWLLQQGVDIGVPLARDGLILWLLTRTRRGIRNRRADLRARHFAQAWKLRSIEAPFQLQQFLDTKDEWTVNEVNKRLFNRKNAKAARALLKALGYQPDAGGTWRLGTSRRAIARRANWTKAERNMG